LRRRRGAYCARPVPARGEPPRAAHGEQEIELGKRAQAGDEEAVSKLVRANLRFVISVAKKYQNRGVSLIDLIQEGNVGLVTAARKFDPTRA
jgi:RNA polymerase primary sigma factor